MKKRKYTFKEAIVRYINYVNRTVEQLMVSMAKLRERYKKVKLHRQLVSGLWSGYISVQ